MGTYLAIDIGASSGRHILGRIEGGKIVLEEVYRFENRQVVRDGHDCWDVDGLVASLKAGIAAAREKGPIDVNDNRFLNPASMAAAVIDAASGGGYGARGVRRSDGRHGNRQPDSADDHRRRVLRPRCRAPGNRPLTTHLPA